MSPATDLLVASLCADLDVPCEDFDRGVNADNAGDKLEIAVMAGDVELED